MKTAFLGVDVGTQGLSVLLVDESLQIICEGTESYDLVPGLEAGCCEQDPNTWATALQTAMCRLRKELLDRNARIYSGDADCSNSGLFKTYKVEGIGIAGQMHGEVLVDHDFKLLGNARLWCDNRNESEATELTTLFGVKCPKRMTVCRWLFTCRNKPLEFVDKVAHITTPAGWISHVLTIEWILGIGDASGVFPVDQQTQDYDETLLQIFDDLLRQQQASGTVKATHPLQSFRSYLPRIGKAGENGGVLSHAGAMLLGLPAGVLVAPGEGDQPAALAGSLIGAAGQVSMSFGTSVACNSVCDRQFAGISRNVDHFCAVDGKPINMVWLRNGTTPMNMIIKMFNWYAAMLPAPDAKGNVFETLMPFIVSAPNDCGGVIASPFMDDEPNMGIRQGGSCGVFGLNEGNSTPGNIAKAILLATMFNLRIGCEIVSNQGFKSEEIILSGGITKSPELGQVVADVFNTPVSIFASGQEGCAWGAALLAKFVNLRLSHEDHNSTDWNMFLQQESERYSAKQVSHRFVPNATAVETLDSSFKKHLKLVALHQQLADIIGSHI